MHACVRMCVGGGGGGENEQSSKSSGRLWCQSRTNASQNKRERSRGGKQQFTATTTEMQSRTHVYVDKRDRHFWIKPALEGGEEKYTA